jgi:hypothetical protein
MKKIIYYVGLDVHKNSIAALAVSFEDHRRAGYFIRVIRAIRGQSPFPHLLTRLSKCSFFSRMNSANRPCLPLFKSMAEAHTRSWC